jgi:hypothetical protein
MEQKMKASLLVLALLSLNRPQDNWVCQQYVSVKPGGYFHAVTKLLCSVTSMKHL